MNFWQRIKDKNRNVLDPIDRISEVLFGLIMVLTFTGSISVATDGRAEVKELLWAALGCNVAWGIVDAVMYLMSRVFERGHGLAVLKRLKQTADSAASRNILRDELPPVLAEVLKPEEIDSIKERLTGLSGLSKSKLLTPVEYRAAGLIFILVFTCTLPVSLPFIFFTNTAFALRSSNIIALLILFGGGYSVGRHSGFHPFRTGLALMVLGIILVAITMALGG